MRMWRLHFKLAYRTPISKNAIMRAVAPNGLVLRILYAESLKCMFKALKRTHDFESVLESTHGLSKWLYRPTRSDANTGEFYLSINTYENTLTFLQKK